MLKPLIVLSAAALLTSAANAQLRITEWMYQSANNTFEYLEITNLGGSPVSLNTYSFDDSSRVPGSFMLSGSLDAGASAIITDILPADFRAIWNLPASVLVLGGNTNNLGRADEINIYNGFDLVDRLTYDDQTLGGPRTNGFAGITPYTNWGANTVSTWFRAASGDAYGSFSSTLNDLGSPGYAPAPGAAAALGLGMLAGARRRR